MNISSGWNSVNAGNQCSVTAARNSSLPAVDGAIVILTPQAMTDPGEVARAVVKSAEKNNKPVMTSWMGGAQVEEGRQILNAARIPDFGTLENAVDAFSYLARYNRNQRLLLQTPARLTRGQEPPDSVGARLIIEGVLTGQRKILTEPESMAVLNAFRIPTVRNAVAHSANEALIIAESIGFPIAMKVLSTDISHKSDAGGVRLNINSAQEVRGAYRQLIDQVLLRLPEANIAGVTVEKMYRSAHGRELMIGIIRDPERMDGQVLSNNFKMLELMESLNFKVSNCPDDNSIKLVEVQLHSMNQE